MHPSAGYYLVRNWIIAYELIYRLLTSVSAGSLKFDGLMDDSVCFEAPLIILPTCSMNCETVVTMHL